MATLFDGFEAIVASMTTIAPEERAYPHGGFTRRGRALIIPNRHNPVALPYGEVRAVVASIPDTAFTIPARLRVKGKTVKGYLSSPYPFNHAGVLCFTPEADDTCEHSQHDACTHAAAVAHNATWNESY